jgi:superoxide dismutase, Cu-Zn family
MTRFRPKVHQFTIEEWDKMKRSVVGLFSLAGALALCMSTTVFAADNPAATIRIEGTGILGQANLVEFAPGFVRIDVRVNGDPRILTPGLHGIHLHAVGSCVTGAGAFSGAGGHFDPGPNGSSLPVELNHPYHLGDLPNLFVDQQGRGRLRTITSRISLADSPTTVFDADGTAVIIHELQDQILAGGTGPQSGGNRLACGIIQRAPAEKDKGEKKVDDD